MKLDWDLCRRIMIAVEEADVGSDNDLSIEIPGHDARVVSYHVKALWQGGYLDAESVPDDEDFEFTWYVPRAVTFSGHRFLAATRDDKVWKRTLKSVGDKVAGATIETVLALAVAEGKKALGLPS